MGKAYAMLKLSAMGLGELTLFICATGKNVILSDLTSYSFLGLKSTWRKDLLCSNPQIQAAVANGRIGISTRGNMYRLNLNQLIC